MFFLLASHAHPIEVWGWSGKSCSKAGALQVNEDTNSLVPTFEEALSRKICLYEFYHSLLRLTVLLLDVSPSRCQGCVPDCAFLCNALTLLGTKAVLDSWVGVFLVLALNKESNCSFQSHQFVAERYPTRLSPTE